MQYLALATDYDGTLAHDSHVSDEALLALRRLKDSGRKVILVTGRELPELYSVFPDHGLCDCIVAENGPCSAGRPKTAMKVLASPCRRHF